MRKLLILLTAMLLFIPAAHALTLPYPEHTVLSVLALTEDQQALAEYLYIPIFNGREDIDLPKGTRYDDVAPAMNALMQDYPELFHLGRDYTVSYYRSAPEYATAIQPQYRMTSEAAAQFRAALYAQAYLLADASPDAVTLHDVLCSLTSYGGDTEMRHTAVGALLEGRATCEGYAQALTLLYRMAGVPCGVIVGVATDSAGVTERHSWNIAAVNDFTLIDATWNDQEGAGLNTRWYFGLSTQQMAADHTPDADMAVPPCTDHAGWHRRMGRCAASREDVFRALQALVETGEPLNLRITDAALYRDIAGDVGRCWTPIMPGRRKSAASMADTAIFCATRSSASSSAGRNELQLRPDGTRPACCSAAWQVFLVLVPQRCGNR